MCPVYAAAARPVCRCA